MGVEKSNGGLFNNTQQGANMSHTIFRLPAVKAETGYSRSTIYARIKEGLWTAQVHLGPRCVGWPAQEVAALNGARMAGLGDADIRALVKRLEAARKLAGLQAVAG